MNPKVEAFLSDLKEILEKNKKENNIDFIGMYNLRMKFSKMKQSEWKWILKQLVSNRKIEIYDPDQKIRLV